MFCSGKEQVKVGATLTNGSPNSTYSVAQFGRNRDDPSQPTFGIEAELEPETASAGSAR